MSERMRRVNEAVRAVRGRGGRSSSKDPRIGMVTVTGVSVSPRPARRARSTSRCSETRRSSRRRWRGSSPRTAYLQGRVARELRLKRTPQLTFEYDPSVERGVRMTKLIDEVRRGALQMTSRRGEATTDLEGVLAALRSNDRFLVVAHENPDGDALGSMLGDGARPARARQGRVMYLAGRRAAAGRVRVPHLDEAAARAARRTSRSACSSPSTARTSAASARIPTLLERAKARRRRRPPPRQHALRRDEPDRRRRVVDGRDRARPARGARRAARRPTSPRRSTSGSSPTRAASSTRTRRRSRSGSPPSSSRRAPTCTGSSSRSTRRCSSRS